MGLRLYGDYSTTIARVSDNENEVSSSFLCEYISKIAVSKSVTFWLLFTLVSSGKSNCLT